MLIFQFLFGKILNKESEIGKEYVAKNLFIPNSPWIDIYNPEAQKTHWNALK